MTCPNHILEHCAICNQVAPAELEEMVEVGWYPCYYIGHVYQHGPVCPECLATQLRLGEDGEYELIPTAERSPTNP